jgi:hypothetical protein
MAPWDEPPSRNCYASKKERLQMEKEKAANKVVEEMMNLIRELFLALDDEDEPLMKSLCIDQSCGYTFRRDNQSDGFSFQQDFLPPTHLHEFNFMIDYMSLYS